ncbi:MAG: hypothetical protein WBN39_13225 [Flavobacteriaceae bacterium]
MKRKLKEELRKLSTDIITARDMNDISELYEASRTLYEKLAVLKFIEEKLHDVEIDVSKNVVAAKFEKMASMVLSANASVPETNPHQEDIITPGMDTIKHMVSEMSDHAEDEDVLAEFLAKPDYMKNDKELFMPKNEPLTTKEAKQKSLNDKLGKNEIKVDLNNKLAFIKHLFNGSAEDYKRVLSQLSTIETLDRSISFVNNMVKPDYGNWKGKEEYEVRFMELIERKFS